MSTKMRQVTKEEFEVLTRFHPGEIRYYVDVGRTLSSRHRGARVTVKRKPVTKKVAKKERTPRKAKAINGTGKGANKPVRFTGKAAGFTHLAKIGTKVDEEVRRLFANDPVKIMGRSDLAQTVVLASGLTIDQVDPVISDLIARGVLAYRKPIQVKA